MAFCLFLCESEKFGIFCKNETMIFSIFKKLKIDYLASIWQKVTFGEIHQKLRIFQGKVA